MKAIVHNKNNTVPASTLVNASQASKSHSKNFKTESAGNIIKHNFNQIPIHSPVFIQPKLTINQPNDVYEKEADAMADKIINTPDETAPGIFLNNQQSIQRKCKECEDEEKGLQRKESSNSTVTASPLVHQTLQSNGKSLDASTRVFMESRFGHDFSKVKIHNEETAQQSAKDINAKAYTHQNNIIFAPGEFNPQTATGKRLLAHELTHTIQQKSSPKNILQRAPNLYGGALGAPADWKAKVDAATDSKTKVALIQSILGSSVTVVDKTAQSSGDASPDPAHLSAYTASSAIVNYDDNLNSKTARAGGRSLSPDAGYTLNTGGNNYVILSAKALDSGNYYSTLYTINHELDHVRQYIAGSSLKGNTAELDAWTSSFIREFHKSYVIQEKKSGECIINKSQQYVPLLGYYEASGVASSDQTNAVKRISDYYNATVKSHPGHLAVFKYWLRRSLDQSKHALADDLIKALGLSITSSEPSKNYSSFSCAGIASQTYTSPSLSLPTYPATSSAKKSN